MVEVTADPYHGYLDRSFDAVFEQMDLPWTPWVGSGFQASKPRTIVLGESVYAWKPDGKRFKTAEEVTQWVLKRDSLRKLHLGHGLVKDSPSADFVRNFERAVFLKSHTTKAERERLWTEVVYFNLVPRLLPSRKWVDRPTVDDYADGWRQFFRVAAAVGAERCVVYGLEWPKIKALLERSPCEILSRKKLEPISRSAPRVMSVAHEGRQMQLVFIRHPSAHFKWDQWGAVMRAHGMHLAIESESETELTLA